MKSIENLLEITKKGTLLKELEIKWIMQKLIEILQKEPNVKYVNAGITVVGDIHGQIFFYIKAISRYVRNVQYRRRSP